ncbi:bifunctional UDP-N-acetylmuramoyl-tripeptide:D-alanyl-D-alanine ligase/alanine racemase [Flavobacterium algicola]|uniref:bifunctional UDP-N-acetylmuramoyl-tripeptide:D-alanyl-D-alanine ligase/alanine racemase n=1 Tax=Flavobacterium algicola TaxID=556529 RepID=UPI001EFDAF64|nr:bifunctional UDP-N-acetylmuramoyl-tripeptide:D-alanyl-D-alanine ligase/alanine racemase [Flavobacterium algicola]MCG9791644.1 bifunctional UDP-N-acetylmuramoyl-tripeptide:D-alanyl-D-alanine ligase/alanine racemase [Flavobacterium algicola]
MNILLKNIISVLSASCSSESSDIMIEHVSIDSRSSHNGAHTLFFSIIGPNNDGHIYVKDLIADGVGNFVVNYIPKGLEGKANFLLVENTLAALQQFAAYYRSLFHFPVIGITGSNGKTIVKEWMNFLLSPDFNIIRSPKSFNSQVGVPLSILGSNEKHNLGIFEAGISTVTEMEKLEPIVKPTIGVLTNIGTSHDEGFESTNQKIEEKLKLFKNAGVLIYKKVKTVDGLLPATIKKFSWSFEDNSAEVFISKIETKSQKSKIYYSYKGQCHDVQIPFEDMASIENAISCLLVMLYMEYDNATICARMSLLYPVEMRLVVKNGINNCSLIDDSYSSDFQSLKIALDFLESQNKFQKKTLILSDIFQSGLTDEVLYNQVAKLVVANHIQRVIGIGQTIAAFKDLFFNCITYPNTADFLDDFRNLDFSNETVLVKGARSFEFEEIVAVLEEKKHETVLEINLNALSDNLNFFKAKLQPDVKIMVMVKAFGYGNGGLEIASLLEHNQVDYLGVAFADEGISLKNDGIRLPIMVLNPESTSFSSIIQYQLEPEIYSLRGLNNFLKIAESKKIKNFPIHIKIDTGMHRLGFERKDIPDLIRILKTTDAVQVKSILSHMATSDDRTHYDFAKGQIQLFDELSTQMMEALQINPIRHILNTSGISNFPEAQFNMVRLGIGIYGVSNDPEEQKFLENVGTLKSIISQIRTIPAGDSVGYGRRFMAVQETKIATIPIGYADGISRGWGNGVGYVKIKNQKAKITGSICMDMLMVDVTEVACNEGDDVIIFGEDPTVVEIAVALHTIPYEILTSISQRVKRVFYR